VHLGGFSKFLNSRTLDFKSLVIFNYRQKSRCLARFASLSPEDVIQKAVSKKIVRILKIFSANRNEVAYRLFRTLDSLYQLDDFTIFRFDFKKCFYSLSPSFICEKWIFPFIDDPTLLYVLKKYCSDVNHCWPGIALSNAMVELAGERFDDAFVSKLAEYSIVFYQRYVDDGILILRKSLASSQIEKLLSEVIYEVFSKNSQGHVTRVNHVSFHGQGSSKFQSLSFADLIANPKKRATFTYLGYSFHICLGNDEKILLKFGVNPQSNKTQKFVDQLAHALQKNKGNELAIIETLKLFSLRLVYQKKIYSKQVWLEKGFLASYPELYSEFSKLDPFTERFLKDALYQGIKKAGISCPSSIKLKKGGMSFSLYSSAYKKKSIVFNNVIGVHTKDLKRAVVNCGFPISKYQNYNNLVNDLLSGCGIKF
jgi:hypothetical protein